MKPGGRWEGRVSVCWSPVEKCPQTHLFERIGQKERNDTAWRRMYWGWRRKWSRDTAAANRAILYRAICTYRATESVLLWWSWYSWNGKSPPRIAKLKHQGSTSGGLSLIISDFCTAWNGQNNKKWRLGHNPKKKKSLHRRKLTRHDSRVIGSQLSFIITQNLPPDPNTTPTWADFSQASPQINKQQQFGARRWRRLGGWAAGLESAQTKRRRGDMGSVNNCNTSINLVYQGAGTCHMLKLY